MKEKKTEVITFRTTPEVRRYLEEEAESTDRSPAYIANKIITEYIQNKNKRKTVNFTIHHNENINL